MKKPVNQYFGIYNLELYTKIKAPVMIRSESMGKNLCLTLSNGKATNYSPIIITHCLNAISYGDNREIFKINSNGFLTTNNGDKCLQSPTENHVNILECGKSSEFRDDREKWMLSAEGFIRSSKEFNTCLTLADDTVGDEVLLEDLKVESTSTLDDDKHSPSRVFEYDRSSYWNSIPTKDVVILDIYLDKYSYMLREIEIDWKFPAKGMYIKAMLSDTTWQVFHHTTTNEDVISKIPLDNKDIMAIKIVMFESTTKIDQMNVYGIYTVRLKISGTYIRREPCDRRLNNRNVFKFIDVRSDIDNTTGNLYKKETTNLNQSYEKLRQRQLMFRYIPDAVSEMKTKATGYMVKLKSMGIKFEEIKLKLKKFKHFLQEAKLNLFTLGASQFTPVFSCTHIRIAFPKKRSGFYWIKNHCMRQAQKVYCDFESIAGGIDYFVHNNFQPVNTPWKNTFATVGDIRYQCYKLGFDAIDIKNQKIFNSLYEVLRILNYNMESKNVVPVGYDFNCDKGKCTKNYKSINNDEVEISDYVTNFSKRHGGEISYLFTNRDLKDAFDIHNLVAFGRIKNVTFEKLNKSRVAAILCSSNYDIKKNDMNYKSIDCNSTLRSDEFSSTQTFSNIRMICPEECASSKALVYGTKIYTDNSSICKAAIHSGVITDIGGIVEVNFEPGKDLYLGSEKFDIKTLDWNEKWDKSFSIKKFDPYCPIKKIKPPLGYILGDEDEFHDMDESEATSFIETDVEESYSLNSSNNLKKEIEEKNIVSELEDDRAEEEIMLQINKILGKNKLKNALRKKEIIKKLTSMINPKSIQGNKDNISVEQSQDEKPVHDNKEFNFREINREFLSIGNITVPVVSTDTGITKILAIAQKQNVFLKQKAKNSEGLRTLIGKVNLELQSLTSNEDYGLENQLKVINNFMSKTRTIKQKIYEINANIQNKLKKTEFNLLMVKEKLKVYNIREQFVEASYIQNDENENWEIHNSKEGEGTRTLWGVQNYNVGAHMRVIKGSGCFHDTRIGSKLILNDKDFYDFELKFSVMIQGDKTFSVAFRMADKYNFYAFQLTKDEAGSARIKKFVHGIETDIDIKVDGGFVQGTWYNIKIRGQQSVFKIYMTDYEGPDLEKHYSQKFQFVDNELTHGTIAFGSLGLTNLYLDNISYTPISCTDFNEDSKINKISIFTPTCSRFYETYKNDFNSRWISIDPLDAIDGPSIWKTEPWIEGLERVLTQQSLIKSTSEFQEGSIFHTNIDTTICNFGRFTIKIKPLDQGIIGLVFRYVNPNNSRNTSYYILEISGITGDKYIRIRKKNEGKFTLLASNPTLGYEPSNWFRLILTIRKDSFNAFIAHDLTFTNMKQVFEHDIIDTDLKMGAIGLSTYQTKAIFDEIHTGPFDNIDFLTKDVDETLYVDEEELNRICLFFNKLFSSNSKNKRSKSVWKNQLPFYKLFLGKMFIISI